ncbi:MAG TPA: xanthine dehydrogenase family protein subunit M [Gaiellaceae bacterium]|nr:xanthine dehydrogenase family protein subunit M [Gaiellaceae bacterium]
MIPAPFDYEVADSPEHALELLGQNENAKLLAGGQSLIPALKLRVSRPSLLVDIGRLSDFAYVRDAGEQIAIGALTRHADVNADPLLLEHCPIVARAAGMVGDPQVRHRGTIGGSLAHSQPGSDLPTVILALDAELVVLGKSGERVVPAGDFFTGIFQTAAGPDELLREIRVPKLADGTTSTYLKMSRRAQDWATVAVAAVVGRSNGSIGKAAIALTNMGPTPLRATATEAAIADGASLEDAAELAADGTQPPSDHAGSADFRAHLARVLTRRALEEAAAR